MAEQSPLIGPSALIGLSWEKYKLRWKTFLGIQLIGIGLIIGGIVLLALPAGLFLALFKGSYVGMPVVGFAFVLYVLLSAIFIMILASWGQLALISAIVHEDKTIRESYAYARTHSVWSFFWLSLLTGFIVFGGMAFFIVPGILFAIWTTFAKYSFLTEKKRGLGALLVSREYFRGRFWPVFGRILIMGILSFMMQMAVSSVPFFGVIVSFAFAPFSALYIYFLYTDLVRLHDKKVKTNHKTTRLLFQFAGVLGVLLILLGILVPLLITSRNKFQKKDSLVSTDKAAIVYFTSNRDKEKRQMSIIVYNDINQDGVRDMDELLAQGGEVDIRNSNGQVCAGVVDEQYTCNLSETGTYVVTFTPHPGTLSTVENPITVVYPKNGPYNQGFKIQFGITTVEKPYVPSSDSVNDSRMN